MTCFLEPFAWDGSTYAPPCTRTRKLLPGVLYSLLYPACYNALLGFLASYNIPHIAGDSDSGVWLTCFSLRR